MLLATAIGCSSSSSTASPTAPTAVVPPAPTAPVPPRRAFTLSGTVTEVSSGEPIEGVELYCDACGPEGHRWAESDANGFYIFYDVYAGNAPLLIRKAGYGDPPGVPQGPVAGRSWRPVIVNGDTRLDIQLARK